MEYRLMETRFQNREEGGKEKEREAKMHVISNSVSRWFSNKLAISNLCTRNMDSNLFPVIAHEPRRNPTLRNLTSLDQTFLTIWYPRWNIFPQNKIYLFERRRNRVRGQSISCNQRVRCAFLRGLTGISAILISFLLFLFYETESRLIDQIMLIRPTGISL